MGLAWTFAREGDALAEEESVRRCPWTLPVERAGMGVARSRRCGWEGEEGVDPAERAEARRAVLAVPEPHGWVSRGREEDAAGPGEARLRVARERTLEPPRIERRRAGDPRAVGVAVSRGGSRRHATRSRRDVALALEDAAHARFSKAFERCFDRLHTYVSRHTDDRQSLERIVSEVLLANLDLFLDRHDEAQEICRLKRSADRLLTSTRIRREPRVSAAK